MMQIELQILQKFAGNPDACESVAGIARQWFENNEDYRLVAVALQNLTNAGLLHRFGEGDAAVYYCLDIALLRSVLQQFDEVANPGDGIRLDDSDTKGA